MPTSLDASLTDLLRLPRWTLTQARAALAAQRASGLCVLQFARQHELAPWRLYDARRRLAREQAATPLRFVELTHAPELTAPRAAHATHYELVLASGETLRVVGTPDPHALRTLLAVLRESAAC